MKKLLFFQLTFILSQTTVLSQSEYCGIGTFWDDSQQQCVVSNVHDSNFDGCVGLEDLLSLLSTFGLCLSTGCGTPVEFDGYTYQTIEIGNQCWFAENLRTTKFKSGTDIPEVTEGSSWTVLNTSGRCDYDNNEGNSQVWGKLYNWYAVNDENGLCPYGWHVPSNMDWDQLVEFIEQDFAGSTGQALKSSAGWTNNGDDAYGFGALPGGARYPILGDFYYGGENGQWWSSDGDGGSTAWYRYLTNFNEDLLLGNDNKKLGQSVRCLKDN